MTANRPRGPFTGVWQIVVYNWPFYVLGACVCAAAIAVLLLHAVPAPQRALLYAGLLGAAWLTLGSLAVSHYVYDRSPLYRFGWLPPLLCAPPARWVNIHAGLDESTPALRGFFPDAAGVVLDIYDPAAMTERSIRRARDRAVSAPQPAHPHPVLHARSIHLPIQDGWADAIFVIFCAHEIRRPEQRLSFFRELHRALARHGRVVLVEHLRDLPNLCAYGPGALHFLPRGEWLRLAKEANLHVRQEQRLTPFIGLFVLEPS